MSAARLSSKYNNRMRRPAVADETDAESKRPDPFPWSETEDIPLPDDYLPTKRKCGEQLGDVA
jgi:hypothetical protein